MSTKLLFKKRINNQKEIKNIVLFSLGEGVSVFGTSIYTFAISLYVLKISGSGLSYATTLVFGLIPLIIFNPIGGALADRYDKKKIVVIMDFLNGLLFLILYVISLTAQMTLVIIYLSTFCSTVFTTIFGMSIETAKPNIVSDQKLMSVNSISKIINSTSGILGPMIGGVIFALVDIQSLMIFNSLTFMFSALSELFIDFNYNTVAIQKKKKKGGFLGDIKEGFDYIQSRKDIKGIFGILIVINFFLGFSVTIPLPFFINNIIKLSSKEFGIIEGAFPIGMIIGAIIVKKIIHKIVYTKLLMSVSVVLSLCMILLGIPLLPMQIELSHAFYLGYYSMIMVIFGISISMIDIPIIYLLQKIIPDNFRGRVLSIGISIGKIILPIALIISGLLLNKVPAYSLPMVGGILFLIINIMILQKYEHNSMFEINDIESRDNTSEMM